jgi:glycosyltransferase involved in cell wall biosynthesis
VSQAHRTRDRLGIPRGATVFGSISTLNDYEGFDTVIEAMRLLADPSIVLLLVGSGPARSRLQEVAQVAGVGHRLVLTGRVPHEHVRDYLAIIDIFVVPRKRTRVTSLVPPIKPLEAMALGVPVLVSDLPPLVEMVRPGLFGERAQPDDPRSWAEQMTALKSAPERACELGHSARDFVSRERTWASAAKRYAEIYAAAAHR